MLSAENFTQHAKRERLTGAVQSLYHLPEIFRQTGLRANSIDPDQMLQTMSDLTALFSTHQAVFRHIKR